MDSAWLIECDEFEVIQPKVSVTTSYRATLVAKEEDRDIAVLKIDGNVKTRPVMLNGELVPFGRSCCAFGIR
jgi:S1-C subfamily serine protease